MKEMLLHVYLHQPHPLYSGCWHVNGVELDISTENFDREVAISDFLKTLRDVENDHLLTCISDQFKAYLEAYPVEETWEEEFDGKRFKRIIFRVIEG